jgi:hypothetical protein
MTAAHDGEMAWEQALGKLESRFGPDRLITLYAIVKGMNPVYTKERGR